MKPPCAEETPMHTHLESFPDSETVGLSARAQRRAGVEARELSAGGAVFYRMFQILMVLSFFVAIQRGEVDRILAFGGAAGATQLFIMWQRGEL